MTATPLTTSPELAADIERMRQRALIVGGAFLALCVVGWFLNPDQFYRSYLVAFVFWNGVALGCMAVMFLHQLSGGQWGTVIRQPRSGHAHVPGDGGLLPSAAVRNSQALSVVEHRGGGGR